MLPGGKYEGQKMTLKRYQGIERRAKCNYFKMEFLVIMKIFLC